MFLSSLAVCEWLAANERFDPGGKERRVCSWIRHHVQLFDKERFDKVMTHRAGSYH